MRKPRSEYPSEQADKFLLRFPDGMRDRLRAEAEANNRSMNAEIVARLGISLADERVRPTQSQHDDASWYYSREAAVIALDMLMFGCNEAIRYAKEGDAGAAERALSVIFQLLISVVEAADPFKKLKEVRDYAIHRPRVPAFKEEP